MDFEPKKEHMDVIKAAREFAEGEFQDRSHEFDREERFDDGIWKEACKLGFVGINIKEEYGGAGMGLFEPCLVTEELYGADAGIALAIMSPTFGFEILDMFGTEEQKKTYLSPLVAGEAKMGTAITEPDAGSDAAGATTSAIKDGDEYVISGPKMLITNGTIADYLAVFCQTNQDNPSRHNRNRFMTVETGSKGIRGEQTAWEVGGARQRHG